MPRLLSLREFAAHVGRHPNTIRAYLFENRIPAAQKVGGLWVIPEDAKIVERLLPGIADRLQHLLAGSVEPGDAYEPEEVAGRTFESDEHTNRGKYRRNMVYAPAFPRLLRESGQSILGFVRKSGLHRQTVYKMRRVEPVLPSTLRKAAAALDKEVEELMRNDY